MVRPGEHIKAVVKHLRAFYEVLVAYVYPLYGFPAFIVHYTKRTAAVLAGALVHFSVVEEQSLGVGPAVVWIGTQNLHAVLLKGGSPA